MRSNWKSQTIWRLVAIIFVAMNAVGGASEQTLHEAADSGQVEVGAFLIEQGINVDTSDRERRTVLGVALAHQDNREKRRCENMVELLRAHGGIE